MTDLALKVDNITHYFEKEGEPFLVLNKISLDISNNEFISIIGPSGCGKSTLIYIMAGFLRPTDGKVIHRGVEVTKPDPNRGVVFQADAVFPWLTVYKNVEFGLKNTSLSKNERVKVVKEYVQLVELNGFENLFPKQLSGGMRKRVDIARTFAIDPDILLLDEPFGSLDAQTKENMQIELMRLWQKNKKTTLFVTHDIEEAIFLADKVMVMRRDPGEFVEEVKVSFPRPRKVKLKISHEFTEMRYKIGRIISRLVEQRKELW